MSLLKRGLESEDGQNNKKAKTECVSETQKETISKCPIKPDHFCKTNKFFIEIEHSEPGMPTFKFECIRKAESKDEAETKAMEEYRQTLEKDELDEEEGEEIEVTATPLKDYMEAYFKERYEGFAEVAVEDTRSITVYRN